MSAAVIDGGVVHYEVFGRGKPVLFLHSWLGSWRYWVPTMEAIADKYRSYALDLWGFGDSEKTKPRYQLSNYVALINDFVSYLGVEHAPLVGHGLGACVVLEYVRNYPDRVKKIMMINPPLTPDSLSRKLIEFSQNSIVAKMMGWGQIPYKEVQQEVMKANREAVQLSLQSVAGLDLQSQVQRLGESRQLGLLVVYGEKDDLIDPTPIRTLSSLRTNIRSIGLADSKHFPMLDEAAKFNRLLKDFLEVDQDLSVLELKEEWRRRMR